MVYSSAPRGETSRYFPETGCLVEGAFLTFFETHGVEFCGLPLTNRVWEGGIPTQYFQRLALEEVLPDQVRLKALGSEVLRLRQEQPAPTQPAPSTGASRLLDTPPFELINQIGRLSQHATLRYASRPLDQLRHLIIHHTGIPASVGPEVIAGYHVTDLNWPGIGYHFMVDGLGRIHQTNPLTLATYHARQFNASGVGIALLGNYSQATPPSAQLDATARLCAWLIAGLGLSVDAIKGHRELVAVTCPGEYWLQGPAWKYSLLGRVERVLRGEPVEEPTPMARPEPQPAAWLWQSVQPPTATPAMAPPATWELPAPPPTPTAPTPTAFSAEGARSSPVEPTTSEEPTSATFTGIESTTRDADGPSAAPMSEDVSQPAIQRPTAGEAHPWWLPISTPAQTPDNADPTTPSLPPVTEPRAPEEASAAATPLVSDQAPPWPAPDTHDTPSPASDTSSTEAASHPEPEPDTTPSVDDEHIPFYPRRRPNE